MLAKDQHDEVKPNHPMQHADPMHKNQFLRFVDFKDRFDFYRNGAGQGIGSQGASCRNASIVPEDIAE
jgi:hypothetical protein